MRASLRAPNHTAVIVTPSVWFEAALEPEQRTTRPSPLARAGKADSLTKFLLNAI